MANITVIGCTPSDILSNCSLTIMSLTKAGHRISVIIAPLVHPESYSSPGSSFSPEVLNFSQLSILGVAQTFVIESFDYSAITQANADAVNSHMKNLKPQLVIMPSWKSPNYARRILARTSLIACRGIGTILMYERHGDNTSFNPSLTFQAIAQSPLVEKEEKELLVDDQSSISHSDDFTTRRSYGSTEEEKFESHRTLLLEEDGLF
jgi:hypothetical protein